MGADGARAGRPLDRPGGARIRRPAVGGTTVVERRDGETLRRQLDAAHGSSPDAIGLISWNEFSENTHIEPSEQYGARYLEVVADVSPTGPWRWS